jgi:hypothetical protein
MIAQVKADTGAEVMVSVWPTVEAASENYQPMFDSGLLGYSETGDCALAAQVGPPSPAAARSDVRWLALRPLRLALVGRRSGVADHHRVRPFQPGCARVHRREGHGEPLRERRPRVLAGRRRRERRGGRVYASRAHTHRHARARTRTDTRVRARTYTLTHVCAHTPAYLRARSHTHVARTHTHASTHTHARPRYTPLPRSDSTFSVGSVDEVGLMFPYFHQQALHDAMAAQVPSPVGPNGTGILTLSRSAWLGSSRWGAAVRLNPFLPVLPWPHNKAY